MALIKTPKRVRECLPIDVYIVRGVLRDGSQFTDPINHYWQESFKFWRGIRDCFMEEMTPKQLNWLNQIEYALKMKVQLPNEFINECVQENAKN